MDPYQKLISDFKKYENIKGCVTTRMIERRIEDKIFTPVIVKREDSICTHPGDVLESAIKDGTALHERNKVSLFLSAVSAGFFLGFSILCLGLIKQMNFDAIIPNIDRLLIAITYPLGFILCIMSGLSLFTEQTALAFYPFLAGEINYKKLFSLWGNTILGNLLGAAMIAMLLLVSEPVLLIENHINDLTWKMISFSNFSIFMSSILAGVLMAHGSWLIKTTTSSTGQILYIFLVTFIIGFGGLHHSIAGGVKLFYFCFSNPTFYNLIDASKFILFALSGNLFGGVFFIGIFNYWQIKHSQKIKYN